MNKNTSTQKDSASSLSGRAGSSGAEVSTLYTCQGTCSKAIEVTAKNGIIERIKDIRRYAGYVDIEKVEQKAGEAPKVIAVTGALSVPRKEFEKEVAGYGWRIASSVTKDVQFLVTDNPNSGSSKNVKAQKMGVSVVSEEDFRNNYMTK